MKRSIAIGLAAIILLFPLSGCGGNKNSGTTGSFGDAAAAATGSGNSSSAGMGMAATAPGLTQSAETAPPETNDTAHTSDPASAESPAPSAAAAAEPSVSSEASGNETVTPASAGTGSNSPEPAPSAATAAKPTALSGAASSAGDVSPSPSAVPSASGEQANNKTDKAPEAAPSAAVKAQVPVSSSGPPQIGWNDFFDDDKQTTPSNAFWDLSEDKAKVQIKGFMGEVLSIEGNWFLLIPEPGAECPFDNGDETYWNKIMIVFMPEGSKLRYTSSALQVTGRLDVGVKVDESGYKTMFRLYDAKFEEIE